jgi:hypothetical protein
MRSGDSSFIPADALALPISGSISCLLADLDRCRSYLCYGSGRYAHELLILSVDFGQFYAQFVLLLTEYP